MEGARLATAAQLPDGKEAVYAGCDLETCARPVVSLSAEAVLDWDLSSSFLLVCSAIFGPDNVCCPNASLVCCSVLSFYPSP
jgi:hypothetical protein